MEILIVYFLLQIIENQRYYHHYVSHSVCERVRGIQKHKIDLMKNLFKILKVQFRFMYGFITLFLICICASHWLNISDDVIFKIITFIEFYITSIIVELISILFFIVKNVFDKSIFDLFKNFDTKDTDKK